MNRPVWLAVGLVGLAAAAALAAPGLKDPKGDAAKR